MATRRLLASFVLALLCAALGTTAADMYCGQENCYDVLGLKEHATDGEVKKAYRKLSLEVHPDKNKSPDAATKFQRVATAYEILSDTERRADYDYALAHPEERLYNQYRYYSQYYKKTYQVDVRVVVAGSLLIFTALQYACRITAYNTAMKQIKSTPRYQHRLKQLRAEAEAEALAKMGGRKGGKKGKQAAPAIDVAELEKQIDVNIQGGYSKPKVEELLLVRMALLPVAVSKWVARHARWVWKYWVLKQPYDEEARILLSCRTLNIQRGLWDHQPEKLRTFILEREIWVPANYKAFVRDWKAQNSK